MAVVSRVRENHGSVGSFHTSVSVNVRLRIAKYNARQTHGCQNSSENTRPVACTTQQRLAHMKHSVHTNTRTHTPADSTTPDDATKTYRHSDRRAKRDCRALWYQDLRDEAVLLRLEVHRRLVRLHLRQNVTGLERVASLLEPLPDGARGHGGRQGGQTDNLTNETWKPTPVTK